MVGIQNITSVTMDNLTSLGNVTGLAQWMVQADKVMFGGIYFFVMLFVFWIILVLSMRGNGSKPMVNVMRAGAVVSVVSFFLRAVQVTLTDFTLATALIDWQMWLFPVVTAVVAWIVHATRE